MQPLRIPALALALTVSICAPAVLQAGDAPALTADMPEIVERSIAFHGGELFLASTTRFQLCSRSGCIDAQVRRDGGLYDHRVEGQISRQHRRIQATNDAVRAWTLDDAGNASETTIPADEQQRWRDTVTARVYHAFLPFRLADPSVRFADLGTETWGDRTLHRVAVGFASGTSTADYDRWAFWFDPETARLEQFAYSYSGNPDGLRFRRLHNFRRVGGLLFADQENLGWEGPGLDVPGLSPESVGRLRHVSDVELREIEVEALD